MTHPYFVVGNWTAEPLDIWHIQRAPDDASEQTAIHDELAEGARDVHGGVEVVWAADEADARVQALREAQETKARIVAWATDRAARLQALEEANEANACRSARPSQPDSDDHRTPSAPVPPPGHPAGRTTPPTRRDRRCP
ncbi:hypothetical protein [Streptomyces sp. NPDC091278]|uniref:hypothetical protein n=1 Tax=Streptomyces sp. NPDC091278 TaxID=3155301 RepID=UPI00344C314C